jgi:predicted MFS family arabinose efflux permease
MIGGLVLTALGPEWCFGLNGLSYLAVIATLVMIRARFQPVKTKESIIESIKGGFRFIRRQGAMESLIGIAFSATVLGFPVVVFLPVFARDVFGEGPQIYTLLMALSGCGSIVGALLVAGFGHMKHKGLGALLGLVVLGLSIAGFAFSHNLVLSCVLLFISGVALIAVFSMVTSLVQLVATDEVRGRVMSVYNVAFRGGMPIGSLITGSLVPMFTAPLVVGIAGMCLAALGTVLLLTQRKIVEL